jgi:hypothetical protein
MLGDDSNTEPPDSIPNSVVKRISGDGSVGLPHVRVAHRQAPNKTTLSLTAGGFLLCLGYECYLNAVTISPTVGRPCRDGAPNKTTLRLTAGQFKLEI